MATNRKHFRCYVDMSTEIFVPIKGFEDRYEISNYGRVKSLPKYTYSRGYPQLRKERILKGSLDGGGYLVVNLTFGNGHSKDFKIHKLVAQAFIDNPDNLPQVNHMDENKVNNRADNLEWCNNAYNVKYSAKPLSEEHKQKLRKPHRPLTKAERQRKRDWANNNRDILVNNGKKGALVRWGM